MRTPGEFVRKIGSKWRGNRQGLLQSLKMAGPEIRLIVSLLAAAAAGPWFAAMTPRTNLLLLLLLVLLHLLLLHLLLLHLLQLHALLLASLLLLDPSVTSL